METYSSDLKVGDDLWVSGGMKVAKPVIFDSSANDRGNTRT